MNDLQESSGVDREKLAHVVHYVCAKMDPRELGRVKLHKILFFADMHWFIAKGRPMTNEQYQKQKFGPTARHLKLVLDQLGDEGKISVSERDYFGYRKQDFISLKEPASNVLSSEEIALLHAVMDLAAERTASELSELSHDRSWELCEFGETIPYFTALSFFQPEVTDEDRSWAQGELERIAVS